MAMGPATRRRAARVSRRSVGQRVARCAQASAAAALFDRLEPEGACGRGPSDGGRRALQQRQAQPQRRVVDVSRGSRARRQRACLRAKVRAFPSAAQRRHADDHGWAGHGRRAFSRLSARAQRPRRNRAQLALLRRTACGNGFLLSRRTRKHAAKRIVDAPRSGFLARSGRQGLRAGPHARAGRATLGVARRRRALLRVRRREPDGEGRRCRVEGSGRAARRAERGARGRIRRRNDEEPPLRAGCVLKRAGACPQPLCNVKHFRLNRTRCIIRSCRDIRLVPTRTQMKTTAKAEDTNPKLADFLCFAVYSANLAFGKAYKPILEELGLTYTQYITIIPLWEEDDQTVSILGEKLFLESNTLTPILKKLEGMGYLERQRDPEDERQVRVSLTKAGRKLREKAFGMDLVEACGLAPDEF